MKPLSTARNVLCLLFLCSVILLDCSYSAAQSVAASEIEGRTITDIQVRGNQRIGSSTILANVRSRRGQPYQAATINEDIKAVQRLRGIQTVFVSTQTDPQRLLVVFQVVEESVVVSTQLQGNRHFSDKDLRKLLRVYEGGFADAFLLARGRQDIAAHYRQGGFHRVQVTTDTSLLAEQGVVVYQIIEGPRTRVRKVLFKGNQRVSSGKLRPRIRTKKHSFIFSAGVFDEQLVKEDVTNLRLYLREQGYLDAQVAQWNEFSPNQKWATVEFTIIEGPLYKIRDIHFQGHDKFSSQELLQLLKVGPGDVPVASDIAVTNPQRIAQSYGREGYIDAQIDMRRVYVQDQPGLIDLVYDIVEGLQVRVGRIDIYGNRITQDRVVRRQLLLAPTDIYDTSRMQRSRQRLLESMLFSQVDISNAPGADPVRDVKIDLLERDTAFLMMGVGVTSDAGVIGDFSLVQRNFDLFNFPTFRGAGQYLRLQAQPGSELMRFSVDFREPYVADLPISFGQSIYLRGRYREDYDEDRLGALWSLGFRFEDEWEIEGAIRLEEVTIRNVDDNTAQEIIDAEDSHGLTTVQGTIIRDKTDSIFLPSQGDIFEVSYEQAGVFGGDYDFGRLEASYACYFTLHTDAMDRKGVLALRVRGGTIFGDAPFFERYYAGGLGSIRGFDFRGVSPRVPSVISADPIAVGSDWLILAGAEYSFPLLGEHFRGATFVDSGAVEDGTYRVSAGLGLRLMVPGFAPLPLSVDFAWPISKDVDDDTRVFNFSLAFPFR